MDRTCDRSTWINRRQMLRVVGGTPALLSVQRVVAYQSQGAGASDARSKFINVNGVKLHYLEWGSQQNPPMVLLHPAPLNAHVWDAFGPAIARHFFVVAPDARGFGESQWAKYDGDVFVEDLEAIVKTLGLKRVTLCGNSMGGTLAFSYAALHPGSVERLIVVDTGPGEKPGSAKPPAPSAGARTGGPPPLPPGPFSSAEDAAAKIPRVFGPAFVKAMTEHNLKRDSNGTWRWKHDFEGTAPAYDRSVRDPRKWGFWTSIQCPTLVLRGENSPAWTQAAAEQMVSENGKATLVVVPNAGHFVPIEQPVGFEAAVRKWLTL